MADRPIEQLTLREKFTDAERLLRELIDHLEKGFLPKLYELQKLVRVSASQSADEPIEDLTVYTHAENVLESEQFTLKMYQRLHSLLESINADATLIVNEG